MDMTLNDYIKNPMGRYNAVLNASTREILRVRYSKKFDNILLRENGKIEYHLFYNHKNNEYWAYIKVPSEVVKRFYYDVVFKFSANASKGGGDDLFDYNMKVYSNDPAFVFTYAHAFAKNNLFIKELSGKMSRQALTQDAKEKNPTNDVGYVKALYFAYLLMKSKKLNRIARFKTECRDLDPAFLMNHIEPADDKIRKRQEEGAKVSTRKKIEVDQTTLRNIKKYTNSDTDMSRLQIRTTKSVSKIKNSANGNAKTTKRTRSVKRK